MPKNALSLLRKILGWSVVVCSLLNTGISVQAASGNFILVSTDSNGLQANDRSYAGHTSFDGRFTAFASGANNLVPNDTNNAEDIFVRDRLANTTTRVSVANLTGAQGDSDSGNTVDISNDGRFVAFESNATNLVDSDTNGLSDVFVRDLQTGTTKLASVDSNGVQANDISEYVSISDDGRYVAFVSSATNLVPNDTNNNVDVFVHDTQTGATVRASVDTSGAEGNGFSSFSEISANGRFVVFYSSASNLVSGDTNGVRDVFVHDLQTGQTTRESVNSAGEQADKGGVEASISGDGRFVTFASTAENLMPYDTMTYKYVYLRDRLNGTTTVVSFKDGYPMYGLAESPVISSDGNTIAFIYDDKGDGMPTQWIYAYNRITGQIIKGVGGESYNPTLPSISGNGQFIVFSSGSSQLVSGDANGQYDVFLQEMIFPVDAIPSVVSVLSGCSSGCSTSADPVVNFNVTFSEGVMGVDPSDFSLTSTGSINGASIAAVTGSGANYVVSVNTGSGNGTLRLDVLDDDSIKDSTNNPLGGIGGGNGNYTSGEIYLIEKAFASVISITRADPDPAISDIVHYTVMFSEPVSGVDASDFSFATTGTFTNSLILDISNVENIYTVTVQSINGNGTIRLDVLDNDSILDSSLTPLGGIGLGNGAFASGESYTFNNYPKILSIQRLDPDPITGNAVHFRVNFTEPVTGVDASDFSLVLTSPMPGSSITAVDVHPGSIGDVYVVSVATGFASGTIRLDAVDDDSILDGTGLPLNGPGVGNGNFAGGETYTVQNPTVQIYSDAFRSNGYYDGWVLESGENSEQGGFVNSNSKTFNLGDDLFNRQFRAILHFPTRYLPDNAVITQAILMIYGQGIVGTDPFINHQNINVDVQAGYFGSSGFFGFNSLDVTDFQSPASKSSAGTIFNNPVNNWYWTLLDPSSYPYINSQGLTQIRLMFQVDDDNNFANDYMTFFSGDYDDVRLRPHLYLEYYVRK